MDLQRLFILFLLFTFGKIQADIGGPVTPAPMVDVLFSIEPVDNGEESNHQLINFYPDVLDKNTESTQCSYLLNIKKSFKKSTLFDVTGYISINNELEFSQVSLNLQDSFFNNNPSFVLNPYYYFQPGYPVALPLKVFSFKGVHNKSNNKVTTSWVTHDKDQILSKLKVFYDFSQAKIHQISKYINYSIIGKLGENIYGNNTPLLNTDLEQINVLQSCVNISEPETPLIIEKTFKLKHDNDDAEESIEPDESLGKVKLDSSDLEFSTDETKQRKQMIGLRFDKIKLPEGAVVVDVSIEFTAKKDSGAGENKIIIKVEDSHDSKKFKKEKFNLSSRDLWYKSVTRKLAQWEKNKKYSLQGLELMLDFVMSKPDWEDKNAITFILQAAPGYEDADIRIGYSRDKKKKYAPKLKIKYFMMP